jgi:ParB family chromosome partitioning protein
MRDAKEAAQREKEKAKRAAKADGKRDAEEKPAKPELTSVAMRYVDLHRQNAVRAELLQAPQLALRLIVASAISREGLW